MISCTKCQSTEAIRFGYNYYKDKETQKYKCQKCGKIYTHSDRLPKNQVSTEIVSLCFDLYFKGFSYRVIQQQLLEQYNLRITHVTIYYWIQRYTELMYKFVKKLNLKISAVWQMDETFIQFKGLKVNLKQLKRSEGYWCWICIDTQTRFVLDMYLGDSFDLRNGLEFFERISKYTDKKPKVVCTDGNSSYIKCIKEFYPDATHILLKHITLHHHTSFIERYNGTVKNRTKTMRCFDSFCPCQSTLTAFQIYYNFLRPHMALKGKTPAQAAGIGLELPERWTSLIRHSLIC